MLKISPEQMQVLQLEEDRKFARVVAAYLRTEHSDAVAVLDSANLEARILMGFTAARRHRLTWRSSLQAFVVLMFLTSPRFDEHPAVQRVLDDPALAANSQLDVLMERTSAADWAAIRAAAGL